MTFGNSNDRGVEQNGQPTIAPNAEGARCRPFHLPLHIFRKACHRPRRVNRPAFLPVLALLLVLAATGHAALEIGKPLWGFDGKVQPNAFTVVSIEIANRGAQPFDGDLELRDQGSGAPLKQAVFLAPGTSRWVQFHPYVGGYVPGWKLSWREGREHAEDMGQPDAGAPAIVMLVDLEAPGVRAVRMRLFAENLFPATVSATDGLAAVVLDHQPRWDAPRREAFLDWVRRGGTVHLLPGADGAVVQFTDDFSPLNITTGDRQRVGAGLVVRHTVGRAEMTEEWLKEHGFAGPELLANGQGNVDDRDGFLLHKLAAITRPNINWGLIYLLTVAYVILIGPVFYVLRKRNYRLLLGGFIATVALFAWVFTVIGRRGYGEKQIYHSVAIARSLGAGRFDVHEWIHAFATTGDIYNLSHGEGGQFYATGFDGDTVRGEIREGKESHIAADIPLFSSRPFLHRGVVKAEDPRLKVEEWTENEIIALNTKDAASRIPKAIRVSASPEFRKRVLAAVLELNGRYVELNLTPGGFELPSNSSFKSANDFLNREHYSYYGHYYGGYYGDTENIIREIRTLHPFLISLANDEPAHSKKYIRRQARSPESARLFLYADAPPGFAMKSNRFEPGQSLVLYVVDIFKP